MASIIKRGHTWRASVCRKNIRKTATFDSLEEAKAWSYQLELSILNGDYIDKLIANQPASEVIRMSDVLEKYGREVTIKKRGRNIELSRIKFLKTNKLFGYPIHQITPKLLAQWREERLKEVKGSTVNRDLNLISAVFNMAIKEWGIELSSNPVHMIQRPKNPSSRDRTIPKEDQKKLCETLKWDGKSCPKTNQQWVAFAFCLSLETAMRRGELLAFRWKDVFLDESYIHLDMTKNGETRDVPLSSKARELLSLLKRKKDMDNVIPLNPALLTRIFSGAVKQLGIENLRFHDSRREATTQLSKKLSNVLELSAVTGHKDLSVLKRYYRPKAADLAKKLD
ncbi:hypothetical protein COMNV_00607 [Commensalibacter sp. Nvir]|uniref:tyrosine-type recombinase/integrase n=1 Tax=Commensalibacter sp. Nvir TaxID=3069817 RepID=UPI002D5B22BA|nr:hypothetical protein COMNV_00607 [Commensalibacter sp. Nvir]